MSSQIITTTCGSPRAHAAHELPAHECGCRSRCAGVAPEPHSNHAGAPE